MPAKTTRAKSSKRKPTAKAKPEDVVRKMMQAYAERGVFRAFSEKSSTGGKSTYKFLWLADHPFVLTFDPKTSTLRFVDIFPGMPSGSDLNKELKDYIKSRTLKTVVEHRRVDASKAEVRCLTRNGNVSLVLKVKKGDFEYGLRRFIGLFSDIYNFHLPFLYMVEHFGMSEE